ncbi:SgcJ/EcaC family oxidoreductase [Nocardia farcinica]|uniref:SgcJ/EcaC family oxidoreductase n=1 Tax=Nocardia farcinica TaxID=37329 RepID=UPI001E5BBB41|nr:SgcJ/EcaC family oxidoreductase [Nocardia farcinica]
MHTDASLDRASDDAAIGALFHDMLGAWTANDADAFGALFTEDSDYVSYDGTLARGRATHQRNHDQLFRGVLAGSALVGDLESIRYVTDDVAVAHGTGSVLMPWRSRLPAPETQAVAPDAGRVAHRRGLEDRRDPQRPGAAGDGARARFVPRAYVPAHGARGTGAGDRSVVHPEVPRAVGGLGAASTRP